LSRRLSQRLSETLGVPSWDLSGDLELEGRDEDGRVGTCPDGILLVPSACPGQGMEMHWVHGDPRATTG
jgi:hypothetical protein